MVVTIIDKFADDFFTSIEDRINATFCDMS